MKALSLIFCILVLMASCSVKENRVNCPCIVEIDLTDFAPVTGSVCVEMEGFGVSTQELHGDGGYYARYSVAGHASYRLSVWSGVSRMMSESGVLSVPEGEDCDSLFLFGASVPGFEEIVRVKAQPHKQFAGVLLRVAPDADGPSGVRYTVKSDYGGIDLAHGTAVKGDLMIRLPGGDGDHLFKLPRQAPSSHLVLEAVDSRGNVSSYPLGEWISEAGYDWTAEDLDDIIVGADFSLGRFDVRVADWEAGELNTQIL